MNMKKFIFLFVALAFTFFVKAQNAVNFDGYWLNASANQRVHQGDSALFQATLTTAGVGTSALSIKWSGPAGVTINPMTPTWQGVTEISQVWFNLPVGVYPFTITGLSASGATSTVRDTLTVLPAIAQRTLTAISVTVNGQSVPLPITGGATLTYSDGTVMKQ